MPQLNELDDYEGCMDTYNEDAKYCYVKSVIKPPDYPSPVYDYILEFSSNIKQHYNHEKLVRGICVNKCEKFITSLNNSIDNYYQQPFDGYETKVRNENYHIINNYHLFYS